MLESLHNSSFEMNLFEETTAIFSPYKTIRRPINVGAGILIIRSTPSPPAAPGTLVLGPGVFIFDCNVIYMHSKLQTNAKLNDSLRFKRRTRGCTARLWCYFLRK